MYLESKNNWKICKKKIFANNLEKSIKSLIENYGYTVNLNHTKGIDLKINNKVKIEIKSCFSYRYRNYKLKTIRIGVFLLKTNELNNVDYYIFIKINNKKNDINYINSINIFIVSIIDLLNYIKKYNVNISNKHFWISTIQFRKIKKINLLDFLENKIIENKIIENKNE